MNPSYSRAGAQSGNLENRKDEEISKLSTQLTDVLQDKEEMKQRYEQRIREMGEQLAMANQSKPGPSTSKARLSTSTSKK